MDITMCKGDGCPVKERCKRFNAEPGMMQSYFVDTPGKWEEVQRKYGRKILWNCDMFWGEQQDQILQTLENIVRGDV